jgi:hypothetical protein
MERRARIVGQYTEPLSRKYGETGDRLLYTFSHSMGSYVWSIACKGMFINKWWNMQGAVPFNAYDNIQEFGYLTDQYGTNQPDPSGPWSSSLRIWHSPTDLILSVAYFLARQTPAVGQIGANRSREHGFWQRDVSSRSGETHGPRELLPGTSGYFERIGGWIREARDDQFATRSMAQR